MVMGVVGFALNGVGIYNDANAQAQDAYIFEKDTFDTCNGHAGEAGAGRVCAWGVATVLGRACDHVTVHVGYVHTRLMCKKALTVSGRMSRLCDLSYLLTRLIA